MLFSFDFKAEEFDEEIRRLVGRHDRFTVYYGLYDVARRSADHVAQVEKAESGYTYRVSGHGVSPRALYSLDVESLLRRIVVDNQFFNMTEQIHIETGSLS